MRAAPNQQEIAFVGGNSPCALFAKGIRTKRGREQTIYANYALYTDTDGKSEEYRMERVLSAL